MFRPVGNAYYFFVLISINDIKDERRGTTVTHPIIFSVVSSAPIRAVRTIRSKRRMPERIIEILKILSNIFYSVLQNDNYQGYIWSMETAPSRSIFEVYSISLITSSPSFSLIISLAFPIVWGLVVVL